MNLREYFSQQKGVGWGTGKSPSWSNNPIVKTALVFAEVAIIVGIICGCDTKKRNFQTKLHSLGWEKISILSDPKSGKDHVLALKDKIFYNLTDCGGILVTVYSAPSGISTFYGAVEEKDNKIFFESGEVALTDRQKELALELIHWYKSYHK